MQTKTEPVSLTGASHFHAICRKCTREKRFYAPTIAEAVKAAVQAGWVMSGFDFESGDELKRFQYTCPKCPSFRPLGGRHKVKRRISANPVGYMDYEQVFAIHEQAKIIKAMEDAPK